MGTQPYQNFLQYVANIVFDIFDILYLPLLDELVGAWIIFMLLHLLTLFLTLLD